MNKFTTGFFTCFNIPCQSGKKIRPCSEQCRQVCLCVSVLQPQKSSMVEEHKKVLNLPYELFETFPQIKGVQFEEEG